MPLDGSVKVAEVDVAALLGTTLVGSNYTIYGLVVSQANFQSAINTTAFLEQNSLGSDVYNSSTTIVANAVLGYQRFDSAYTIALSLPGYMPTWFNYGVGDERYDPNTLALYLKEQADRFLKERDRAFTALQNILSGNIMIDSDQPGYSQPSSPIY